MKYIQDFRGVHGFDDTDPAQGTLMNRLFYTNGALNSGCTDVTGSWPPAPTFAQLWAAYQHQAALALESSDTAMHRIAEAVAVGATAWTAADVVAFVNWRRSLRTILVQSQPTTLPPALPARPPYPAGT